MLETLLWRHAKRVFICPQPGKARVPEVSIRRPLLEVDLCDEQRLHHRQFCISSRVSE